MVAAGRVLAGVLCGIVVPAGPHSHHASLLSRCRCQVQVETGPYPHLVINVRSTGSHDALPAELRGALRLPGACWGFVFLWRWVLGDG